MPSCSSEMMSILESLCTATFIDPSWHDNQWDMIQDINKHPSWPNNHWDMTQDVNKVYIRYGTSYWEKIQERRFWCALKRYVIIEVNGILEGVLFFHYFDIVGEILPGKKNTDCSQHGQYSCWRTLKKRKRKISAVSKSFELLSSDYL